MFAAHDFKATYRGQVESWEIDANRHWNARFFVRTVQNAMDWILAVEARRPEPGRLLHRHMRFHRELLADDMVEAGSAITSDEPSHVAHAIWNGDTGEVCATATDVVSGPVAGLPRLGPEASERFRPRSLSLRPLVPADTARLVADDAAVVSYRGVVRPQETDGLGRLLPHAIFGFIAEGQGWVWTHAKLPVSLLARHGIGRVLVEMAMTFHGPADVGEPVEIVSWFERLSGKLFAIRYQLDRSTDGAPLASISTVGVFIDRETRTSTPLPEELAARVGARS